MCNRNSGLQMVVAEQLHHLLYTSRSSNHWLTLTGSAWADGKLAELAEQLAAQDN